MRLDEMPKKKGRKVKYTPVELKNLAKAYFDSCDAEVVSTNTKTGMTVTRPKTISGLCLYLGVDKDYVNDLRTRPDYRADRWSDRWQWKDVYAYIMGKIENDLEEGLLTGTHNPTGAIFALKNRMGWVDKTETKNENDNKVTITFKD